MIQDRISPCIRRTFFFPEKLGEIQVLSRVGSRYRFLRKYACCCHLKGLSNFDILSLKFPLCPQNRATALQALWNAGSAFGLDTQPPNYSTSNTSSLYRQMRGTLCLRDISTTTYYGEIIIYIRLLYLPLGQTDTVVCTWQNNCLNTSEHSSSY